MDTQHSHCCSLDCSLIVFFSGTLSTSIYHHFDYFLSRLFGLRFLISLVSGPGRPRTLSFFSFDQKTPPPTPWRTPRSNSPRFLSREREPGTDILTHTDGE
ncbi:uncharacterized protein BO97DRAFT_281646 [Aspergillus homomorphus CBS 101889]|uniref:Uncharacterized protein n=1 Tax=Aspergillus homomorphus (strain CBS 101889) TaxID=1450537 RepID=A0A395I3H5_ASPHC|nr:hypothetical protein BO97DRAFT_281646 [Aspergillus homomorphus CBS 101889]RAL14266.1 hypothetical protein BO97DRAFT_281646 [Aspergillus homomorphus CBS 101889]